VDGNGAGFNGAGGGTKESKNQNPHPGNGGRATGEMSLSSVYVGAGLDPGPPIFSTGESSRIPTAFFRVGAADRGGLFACLSGVV
jgi:hypothetical protein